MFYQIVFTYYQTNFISSICNYLQRNRNVDLDYEEAKKTAKELAENTGRKVIAIQTDCTNKEQVDAMTEQVVNFISSICNYLQRNRKKISETI